MPFGTESEEIAGHDGSHWPGIGGPIFDKNLEYAPRQPKATQRDARAAQRQPKAAKWTPKGTKWSPKAAKFPKGAEWSPKVTPKSPPNHKTVYT